MNKQEKVVVYGFAPLFGGLLVLGFNYLAVGRMNAINHIAGFLTGFFVVLMANWAMFMFIKTGEDKNGKS